MIQRKWSSEEKLKIVLEDLSDQIEIAKLYNKYQISQDTYYRWREQLTDTRPLKVRVSPNGNSDYLMKTGT